MQPSYKRLKKNYIKAGLKMNNSKTQIVKKDSKKKSEDKIYSEMYFQWTMNFNL